MKKGVPPALVLLRKTIHTRFGKTWENNYRPHAESSKMLSFVVQIIVSFLIEKAKAEKNCVGVNENSAYDVS